DVVDLLAAVAVQRRVAPRVDLDDAQAQGHRVKPRLGVDQLEVAHRPGGLLHGRAGKSLRRGDDHPLSPGAVGGRSHAEPPGNTWRGPFGTFGVRRLDAALDSSLPNRNSKPS